MNPDEALLLYPLPAGAQLVEINWVGNVAVTAPITVWGSGPLRDTLTFTLDGYRISVYREQASRINFLEAVDILREIVRRIDSQTQPSSPTAGSETSTD